MYRIIFSLLNYLKLYSFFPTDCNSIETCSKFIENKNGSAINLVNTVSSAIFTVKKGYNLIDKSLVENYTVFKNMVPTLIYGNIFLSIDTSNGTKYPDYNFNMMDSYKPQVNLNRINLNLNWRYFIRFRYDYEENGNIFRFNKTYSKCPISSNDGFNVSVWLNLTDDSKYSVTQNVRSKLTTTSSFTQTTLTLSDLETTKAISLSTISKTEENTKIQVNKNDQNYSNNKIEEFLTNLPLNTSFDLSNLFSLNSNDSSNELLTNFLIQNKYDLTSCISNCSNKGLCKLEEKTNKLKCQCESFDFTGNECQLDQRPCSQEPCLNYLTCKNIFNSTQFDSSIQSYKNVYSDFECLCKDGYFGKRCESKINFCQNETCSSNGLCKVINQTIIKCECFGINAFEGKECEKKTNKLMVIQATIKISCVIAIIIIISLFGLIFLMDLNKILVKPKEALKKKNCK